MEDCDCNIPPEKWDYRKLAHYLSSHVIAFFLPIAYVLWVCCEILF